MQEADGLFYISDDATTVPEEEEEDQEIVRAMMAISYEVDSHCGRTDTESVQDDSESQKKTRTNLKIVTMISRIVH